MALITLSRNQFLQRKPKGDYQSYLRYIGKARAGVPHGTPRGKLVDLPMNPAKVNALLMQNLMGGALNPQQMRKKAVQAVNDSIRTALGDVRETTAAAQEQANRQASAYEGFAKTLADARRSDADYIVGLYRDAAADQARFAGGITGAVGAAAQADAASQIRDVAAATGQGPEGFHAPDPQSMANVGFYLGGQIPAARLSENAAYLGQNALAQGLASAERLGLESAGMRQKTLDLQAELARARTKLTAGRPAAIREQLDQLADDQRANLATLANVLYLQNTQGKTTADLLGTYQGQPTINTYRDKQGRLRQYDPNRYTVKTSKNGTQFLAPLPVPKSSSSTPRNKAGLTPSQVATQERMRNEALQSKRADMLKVVQNQKGPLYNPVPAIAQGLREPTRKSYTQARQYLLTNYANDLIKQYPGQRAAILAMVDQVLASEGFTKARRTKGKPLPAGGLAGIFAPSLPVVPVGR